MTIGRDDNNTIRLTERNVSRRHARLMRQNGSIFVEDLKSFTGVRVNGNKIAALTALGEGDQVQIGDYKIRVRSDRPSDPAIDRATRPAMQVTNGSEPAAAPPTVPAFPAAGPIRTPVPTRTTTNQPSTAVTSMGRAVTPRPTVNAMADLLPVPDPIE